MWVVASADARPTDQSYETFKDLSDQADILIKKLQEIVDTKLPEFNKIVRDAEIPAVVIKSSEKSETGETRKIQI